MAIVRTYIIRRDGSTVRSEEYSLTAHQARATIKQFLATATSLRHPVQAIRGGYVAINLPAGSIIEKTFTL